MGVLFFGSLNNVPEVPPVLDQNATTTNGGRFPVPYGGFADQSPASWEGSRLKLSRPNAIQRKRILHAARRNREHQLAIQGGR
jgi:hypothetical protein